MAIQTRCQTNGARFSIEIQNDGLTVDVDFGRIIDLTAVEATELESNVHNALELVLARYWVRSDDNSLLSSGVKAIGCTA